MAGILYAYIKCSPGSAGCEIQTKGDDMYLTFRTIRA